MRTQYKLAVLGTLFLGLLSWAIEAFNWNTFGRDISDTLVGLLIGTIAIWIGALGYSWLHNEPVTAQDLEPTPVPRWVQFTIAIVFFSGAFIAMKALFFVSRY